MGRKRKSNPLGLPDRLYFKGAKFWYVHRDGRWEDVGPDLAQARKRAKVFNAPGATYGTMAFYLDAFIEHCRDRNRADDLSDRTLSDYEGYLLPLKGYFGHMQPASIEPFHVGQYLDINLKLKRGISANRERAGLSACFTWIIRNHPDTGVKANPCFRVRRNKEVKRTRYVEHEEYAAVWKLASSNVRALMDLEYRTLQRPEDLLKLTERAIITVTRDDVVERVLRIPQGKKRKGGVDTKVVEIAVTPAIDAILERLRQDRRQIVGMTLIHNRSAKKYTESGIASMLRRYCKKAGVPSFGPQDLKAKGATDMYLAGVPIEQISALCGHERITTTQIYIKRHLKTVVRPNMNDIPGVPGLPI